VRGVAEIAVRQLELGLRGLALVFTQVNVHGFAPRFEQGLDLFRARARLGAPLAFPVLGEDIEIFTEGLAVGRDCIIAFGLVFCEGLALFLGHIPQHETRARHRALFHRHALVLHELVDLLQDVHVGLEHLFGGILLAAQAFDAREGDDGISEREVQRAPLNLRAEFGGLVQGAGARFAVGRLGLPHVEGGLMGLQEALNVAAGPGGQHPLIGLHRALDIADLFLHLAVLVRGILIETEQIRIGGHAAAVLLEERVVERLGLFHLLDREIAVGQRQLDGISPRIAGRKRGNQLLGILIAALRDHHLRGDQLGALLLVGMLQQKLLHRLLREVGIAHFDQAGGELELAVHHDVGGGRRRGQKQEGQQPGGDCSVTICGSEVFGHKSLS